MNLMASFLKAGDGVGECQRDVVSSVYLVAVDELDGVVADDDTVLVEKRCLPTSWLIRYRVRCFPISITICYS